GIGDGVAESFRKARVPRATGPGCRCRRRRSLGEAWTLRGERRRSAGEFQEEQDVSRTQPEEGAKEGLDEEGADIGGERAGLGEAVEAEGELSGNGAEEGAVSDAEGSETGGEQEAEAEVEGAFQEDGGERLGVEGAAEEEDAVGEGDVADRERQQQDAEEGVGGLGVPRGIELEEGFSEEEVGEEEGLADDAGPEGRSEQEAGECGVIRGGLVEGGDAGEQGGGEGVEQSAEDLGEGEGEGVGVDGRKFEAADQHGVEGVNEEGSDGPEGEMAAVGEELAQVAPVGELAEGWGVRAVGAQEDGVGEGHEEEAGEGVGEREGGQAPVQGGSPGNDGQGGGAGEHLGADVGGVLLMAGEDAQGEEGQDLERCGTPDAEDAKGESGGQIRSDAGVEGGVKAGDEKDAAQGEGGPQKREAKACTDGALAFPKRVRSFLFREKLGGGEVDAGSEKAEVGDDGQDEIPEGVLRLGEEAGEDGGQSEVHQRRTGSSENVHSRVEKPAGLENSHGKTGREKG
ncbi:MAG: hypothetical protein RLZZ244_2393, partial [Verrucomicrobiota bacterium]